VTAPSEWLIERVELPMHESSLATKLDEWKQLRRAGWELSVLVLSIPPAGRHKLRRDVYVVAVGYLRADTKAGR
jgi:hypothetical protein